MRRLALLACLSLGWAVQPGFSQEVPGWPDALGRALASAASLTDLNVAEALAPEMQFERAACKTASLPGGKSPLAIASAFIVYDDESACNRMTRLALLEVSIAGGSAGSKLGRLQSVLSTGLGAPCFAGDLPGDKRRHAPARHLVAWRSAGRVVALGTEAGDADLSVSLLQTGPATFARSPQAIEVQSTFLAGLPAACR